VCCLTLFNIDKCGTCVKHLSRDLGWSL
jgi:hypothetical protein